MIKGDVIEVWVTQGQGGFCVLKHDTRKDGSIMIKLNGKAISLDPKLNPRQGRRR